jgi:hypothetical protein
VPRLPSMVLVASVSRTAILTEPKTIKQKEKRFLRWRKRKGRA